MTHPLDRDAIEERRRKEAKLDEFRRDQFKADLRYVLDSEPGRRILYLFMQHMGADESPFSTNGMAMGHAVGRQDAVRWWVDYIREFCPEKEARIREEGRAWENRRPTDEDES